MTQVLDYDTPPPPDCPDPEPPPTGTPTPQAVATPGSCECTHVDPLGGLSAPGAYPPGTFGGGPTTPGPTITGLTPSTGLTGAVVTITGTNFVAGSVALQDGVPMASSTFVNATTLIATVVAGDGSLTIKVRNPDGQTTPTGLIFNQIG